MGDRGVRLGCPLAARNGITPAAVLRFTKTKRMIVEGTVWYVMDGSWWRHEHADAIEDFNSGGEGQCGNQGWLSPENNEETLGKLEAEAAYFTVQDGVRTGFIYFDMVDQSDMVAAGEPLFIGLDAEIDLTPAMTPEDLQTGFKKAFG
jgi:hypothetical protein